MCDANRCLFFNKRKKFQNQAQLCLAFWKFNLVILAHA